MPNWTENKLQVDGTKEECEKFLAHMGEEMDFEKVIPSPKDMFKGNFGDEERKVCEEKGIPNWLDWQSDNWGTKWNACRTEPVQIDAYPELSGKFMTLTYKFITAWDTPRPVIAKLWEQWPDLFFGGGYLHEGYEGCGNFGEFKNCD